ncbi:MAG: AMP-binding protein [Propionibacteriaceae bacterium]|nr:AMP-binding protein [Propionibacteriaceae bacterium]
MVHRPATPATEAVRHARDFLIAHATDLDAAREGFRWPDLAQFNFALEWFDVIAAEHPDRPAVMIADEAGVTRSWSYGDLAQRSDQVANWLTGLGMKRGDAMLVMLPNTIELWEVMLGLLKVGGVAVPTSILLSPGDLEFRASTSHARFAIAPSTYARRFGTVGRTVTMIALGASTPDGWNNFDDSFTYSDQYEPERPTDGDETSLLYFTSGTTSHPKLVRHTHTTYPVGHLSTLYWLGLRPGDIHLNISSPGWAKHAWSSFFAPFLAEATVFIMGYDRFDAASLIETLNRHHVTTFCAPPTVWRMLVQTDLTAVTHPPREVLGAGEALNPEIIAQVRRAWGVTIRDGFGQTEMTCAVGNTPGQPVKAGSMGRPMPGYTVVLVDPATGTPTTGEGEICLDLTAAYPLSPEYVDDPAMTSASRHDGYYHTGDLATCDEEGYLTYVGRTDDVFKASGYKISPFELESILLEHPDVTEVAVVASPDPVRAAVPKAFVRLSDQASAPVLDVARGIFEHARHRLSGHEVVRIVEFVTELPKTISGKIRRAELRQQEALRVERDEHSDMEYREKDFRAGGIYAIHP